MSATVTTTTIGKRQLAAAEKVAAKVAAEEQRHADALTALRPDWQYRCSCPDFEFRGRYRTPPYCKHCVGVGFTLSNNHAGLNRLNFFPDFVNDDGPLGYTVPEGRAWDVRAAPSHSRTGYNLNGGALCHEAKKREEAGTAEPTEPSAVKTAMLNGGALWRALDDAQREEEWHQKARDLTYQVVAVFQREPENNV